MSDATSLEHDGARVALEAEQARLRSRFPTHPRRYVYVLVGVGAVDAADRTILAAVFEDVKRAFDISDSQLGVLVAAYSVVATLSLLPFGWAADRFNRVRLIALGFLPWSIAMLLTGAATSFAMMFVARLFLGSVEATNGPSTPSLLGDYYPVSERSRVYGTYAVGALLGSVLGLAGGGIIASLAGWRAAFFIWGALGFVCAALVLRLLPEPERGLPDAIHRVATQLQEVTRDQPATMATVPDATGYTDPDYRHLTIRQAFRELRRVRTMWIVFIAAAVGDFAMSGLAVWAPTFFRRYHGLNAAAAGGLVALLALSTVAGVVVGSRLGDRYPARRVHLAGFAGLASYGSLLVAYRFDSMPLVVPSFLVSGFLIGLPMAPLGAVGLDVLVPHLRGRANALRSILRVTGTATAPLLFGVLSDYYGLRSALLYTMPALSIAGAILLLATRTYAGDMERAQEAARRQQARQAAEI